MRVAAWTSRRTGSRTRREAAMAMVVIIASTNPASTPKKIRAVWRTGWDAACPGSLCTRFWSQPGPTITSSSQPGRRYAPIKVWNQDEARADSSATTMNAMTRRVRTGHPPTLRLHRPEPVPEAPHGLDVAGLGRVGLDLRPQPLHARVHQPGIPQVVVFPHQIEQLLPGEHLPRRGGQHQQQPQLGWGQRQLAVGPAHDQRTAVYHQVTVCLRRRAGPRHAAQHRPDPRIEHPRLHRLHHVIVGPGLQAPHDVQVVAPCRQHDDRDIAVAAQPTAYLEAVQPWEHHVEHYDVGRGIADVAKRRLTGPSGMHTVAETAQGQLQALPGSWIVLD